MLLFHWTGSLSERVCRAWNRGFNVKSYYSLFMCNISCFLFASYHHAVSLPTNLQWTLLCVVNIINIQVSFSHSLFCFLLVDIIVPKTYQITNINHDPFINNMSTKTKVWTNPKSQTILLWNFVCLSTLTHYCISAPWRVKSSGVRRSKRIKLGALQFIRLTHQAAMRPNVPYFTILLYLMPDNFICQGESF
jgi:hypothetical protein